MDQDNRRPHQEPDTLKSDRSKKRMRGSGSTSDPKAVAAEVLDVAREEEEEKERGVLTGTCSVCGEEFYSMQTLFDHMESHSYRNPKPPPTNETVEEEDQVASSLILLASITPEHHKSSSEAPETATVIIAASDNVKEKDKCKEIVVVSSSSSSTQPPSPPLPPAEVVGESPQDGGDVGASATVFECSGCKRVFDSHQALGGHRASHKNIQGCYAAEKKDQTPQESGDGERGGRCVRIEERRRSTAVERILQTSRMNTGSALTRRMYTCSVCNKTFSTGQALGGHMRWHLERNQYLGMALAAAASGSVSVATTLSSFSSSSSYLQKQLNWSNLGKGTSGSSMGGVPSQWSSSTTDTSTLVPSSTAGTNSHLQQLQPHGHIYGGWNLQGRDHGVVGSSFSSNIIHPQSDAGDPIDQASVVGAASAHSTHSYPTLSDLTRARIWINPGDGRRLQSYGGSTTLGFGSTFSSASRDHTHALALGGQRRSTVPGSSEMSSPFQAYTLPAPWIHLSRGEIHQQQQQQQYQHQHQHQHQLEEWMRGGSSSRVEYNQHDRWILPRGDGHGLNLDLTLGNSSGGGYGQQRIISGSTSINITNINTPSHISIPNINDYEERLRATGIIGLASSTDEGILIGENRNNNTRQPSPAQQQQGDVDPPAQREELEEIDLELKLGI